jgi:hypothetical protein
VWCGRSAVAALACPSCRRNRPKPGARRHAGRPGPRCHRSLGPGVTDRVLQPAGQGPPSCERCAPLRSELTAPWAPRSAAPARHYSHPMPSGCVRLFAGPPTHGAARRGATPPVENSRSGRGSRSAPRRYKFKFVVYPSTVKYVHAIANPACTYGWMRARRPCQNHNQQHPHVRARSALYKLSTRRTRPARAPLWPRPGTRPARL